MIRKLPFKDRGDGKRAIRSFVLRGGRLTEGQQKAYDRLWPQFGIEIPEQGELDLDSIFGRAGSQKIIEIGFGMGGSLVEMAKQQPEKDFVGIEVHPPGIGRILLSIEEQQVSNLRVIQFDAVEVLTENIADQVFSGAQIYFPDPWHKKKHNKRRIIQPEFLELLASKMKPGALLHLATDWENYAEHMMEVLTPCEQFDNFKGEQVFSDRPYWRPDTKFQKRGERLGHGMWDLLFLRK